MKTYIKVVNGQKIYKQRSQIVITKNGMNTYNPTEEMILADGWVEYVYKPETEEIVPETPEYIEESIEHAKKRKIKEIEDYDQSDNVNIFYVQDIPVWLDKATRTGLMLRFQAEKTCGKYMTTLWYNGIEFQLDIERAMRMLYELEVYASACYDTTQKHIYNVNSLESVEDVNNYDFRCSDDRYPEPLRF